MPTEAAWAAHIAPSAASGRPSTQSAESKFTWRERLPGAWESPCTSPSPVSPGFLPGPEACSPFRGPTADALAGCLLPVPASPSPTCVPCPCAPLSAQPPEASAEPPREGSNTTSLACGDAQGKCWPFPPLRVTQTQPAFPRPCW